MFIDLDTNKEFRFRAMIYHLKKDLVMRKYLVKKVVEPILFLSRQLNPAETQYWPTELELVGIIWVL